MHAPPTPRRLCPLALALALALALPACGRPPAHGAVASAPRYTPPAARPSPSAPSAPSAPSETSTPGAPESAAAPRDGVPVIAGALADHVRDVLRRGRARGLRPGVFAKLGDSMSESASFLGDAGHGWAELGPYTELASTIAYFHRTTVDAEGNDSFAHASVAAAGGWATSDALNDNAVGRELDALRPALALVLFGTNDVDRGGPDEFARNLARITAECDARDVLVVLSTIPDRRDERGPAAAVPSFNAVIARLAAARSYPLIELNAALRPLPRAGLDADGIHTSAYVTASGDVQAVNFTPPALRYGYNLRNLITLRTLARLRDLTLDPGAAP